MTNLKLNLIVTRKEVIDTLVSDRLDEWVVARNTDGLVDILRTNGWKAYGEMADKELLEHYDTLLEQNDIHPNKIVLQKTYSNSQRISIELEI